MTTKFYWGDYTSFGHPTSIITEYENESNFYLQAFVIFESSKPVQCIELNSSMQKPPHDPIYTFNSETLLQFANNEIHNSIYDFIVSANPTHPTVHDVRSKINFKETTHSMLAYLRDKFPTELTKIETNTKDEDLRRLIGLYKSIVVTKIA
jgi:hypothetical protein